MTRDLGDFPTPPGLVRAVLDRLGSRWSRVLEPTCGRGRFLEGCLALESPPSELFGIELQSEHLAVAMGLQERVPTSSRVVLRHASLFDVNLASDLDWQSAGPLLVVGNPPWVTNAGLGALQSTNLPIKRNLKHDRGLDAITGSSNFDIAEAIWLKLIAELAHENATIALLCKMSVARRVLDHAHREGLAIESAEVVAIDARAWFGVSVEACLLTVRLGRGRFASTPVFDRLEATDAVAEMGFVRGKLVSDIRAYAPFAFADGSCPLTWRQGLKHDAASVMELSLDASGAIRNGRDEIVDIEPDYVFPLLKGTDLSRVGPIHPRRAVIVTQRKPGQDTLLLRDKAPRLWNYLEANLATFARRRSSIYRGSSPYSIFGIGPYSFEPFKVAVSGLHQKPRFHALGPVQNRPLMLDDTSYGLACRSAEQAGLIAALLNTPESLGLLASLTFRGAKRPVTKSVLQRIDLGALLCRADRGFIIDQARRDVEHLTGRAAVFGEPIELLLDPRAATNH